jgi:predicted AlkP superfamily pyrophosphatase or phosphodiesterase
VNSKEIQDAYLRLDATLADFLKYLDETVGDGEYTVFLTADHGGVDVPAYLKSRRIPAGYFSDSDLIMKLGEFLKEEFKAEDLIANISNSQIFFDYSKLKANNIDSGELQGRIAHFLLQQDNVSRVFTRKQLQAGAYDKGIANLIENGYNQKRSGDVVFVTDPGYIVYSQTGSQHGSGFSYDTHVPLIFFGKGVKKGSSFERAEIPDIAPTISSFLGISFPNATTGQPLKALLEN